MDLKRMNEDERAIFDQLLFTWQSVKVISIRSNLTVKAALKILLQMESRGIVKKIRSRVDGHNKTHHFKRIEYLKVLGVTTTVEASEEE